MTTLNSATLEMPWKILLMDPNDPGLLQSWIEKNEKVSGEAAARAALQRAAALPESWLAKIWLTRLLLTQAGGLNESLDLYRNALQLAPRKSLAVQEISGHLGEAGFYREAVDLLLPIYSPDDHGPWAGFNLFNACEDCDDLDSAREVLNRMSAAHWPDEPDSFTLKKIVQIRQEKLTILREMRNAGNERGN